MTYCHSFNPKGKSLLPLYEKLETWKSVNLLIQELDAFDTKSSTSIGKWYHHQKQVFLQSEDSAYLRQGASWFAMLGLLQQHIPK